MSSARDSEINKIVKRLRSKIKKRAVRALYYIGVKAGAPYSDNVDLRTVSLGGRVHFVARMKNVSVFTNRLASISFVCGGRLVEEVSLDTNTLRDSLQPGRSQKLSVDNSGPSPSIGVETGAAANKDPASAAAKSANSFVRGEIGPSRIRRKASVPVASIYAGGGTVQYYPWMVDCLPRLKLMLDAGFDPHDCFLWGGDVNLHFQAETLKELGFDLNKVLDVNKYQHFRAPACIATSHPATGSPTHPDPWVIDFLRDSFLAMADRCEPVSRTGLVLLSRRDAKGRNLENEDELFDALKGLGFERFNMTDLTLSQQIRLFRDAKVIVGTHGAAFTNLCFEGNKPKVVEIFPKRHKPDMYESICKHRGLEYHSIVASQEAPGALDRFNSIRLSGPDIEQIVGFVDKRA